MSSELSNENEWSFHVEGMHCIKCIRKLQSIEIKIPEIKHIKVDLGSKKVTVKATSEFSADVFKSEVSKLGFETKQVLSQDSGSEDSKNKKFLFQIGIAGFCSGNIMLFSAAEYVGAHVETWSQIFPILSGILFCPVLFYSAQPFFLNSYYAFKAKRVSIDSPIVLAIVGGAGLSYFNLFNKNGEIYFDSIAMFIFLLLFSRYLIFKIQNKYLSPIKVQDVYSEGSVDVIVGNVKKTVPIDQIKIDDLIEVKKNGYIPLDGELVSENGLISDAFFSGEFLPKSKVKQDFIYAGSKVISSDVFIKVKKNIKDTRLSEIIDKLNQSMSQKTEITTLADRGANFFTLGVVSLAVLVLGYFSFFDIQEGINRVIALLVVACPCGLAIVVPLVQSLAIKKALKKSLLIKKPSAFESVQNIKNIYFDKTGTLTSGEIKVYESSPREPNELEKKIIYNLERQSEHPVASALVKWVNIQEELTLNEFQEKIGTGVSGYFESDYYEIKSSKDEINASVNFYKNFELQFSILIEDTIADEASDVIKFLSSLGIQSYILSGDLKSHAEKIGDSLGLNSQFVYSALTPEDKLRIVEKINKPSIFIGDGVNDSIAMSKCLVSVSMQSSANVAFKSSDVHILSGGLNGIKTLFDISNTYLSTIKATIVVSFLYNATFAIFALLGYVGPLVAVFLMPLSSLTVTFFALYLMSDYNVLKIFEISYFKNKTKVLNP